MPRTPCNTCRKSVIYLTTIIPKLKYIASPTTTTATARMHLPIFAFFLAALAAAALGAQSNESICRQKSQRTGSLAAASIRAFCAKTDLVANSHYAVSSSRFLCDFLKIPVPHASRQAGLLLTRCNRCRANTPAPIGLERTLSLRPSRSVPVGATGCRRGIASVRCMRLVRRGISLGME